jgi:hypothetical protein
MQKRYQIDKQRAVQQTHSSHTHSDRICLTLAKDHSSGAPHPTRPADDNRADLMTVEQMRRSPSFVRSPCFAPLHRPWI